MSAARQSPASLDEAAFFAWLDRQPEPRHELVDGQPRAMTGGTQQHALAIADVQAALRARLRGGPCRTVPNDLGIRIASGNVRYPDIVVDCGPYAPAERVASTPILAVEILSPSAQDFGQSEKLEEYKTVPSLRHILVIDPDQPRARLHSRDAAGHWSSTPHAGLEATIPIPALDLALPLAETHEGLTLRPQPRRIPPPGAAGTA